ncbi:hypothetical protein V8E54_012521 [Elaphomyces granulatus]
MAGHKRTISALDSHPEHPAKRPRTAPEGEGARYVEDYFQVQPTQIHPLRKVDKDGFLRRFIQSMKVKVEMKMKTKTNSLAIHVGAWKRGEAELVELQLKEYERFFQIVPYLEERNRSLANALRQLQARQGHPDVINDPFSST